MGTVGLTFKQLLDQLMPDAVMAFVDNVDAKADQAGYIYRTVAPPKTVDDLRIEIVKGAFNRPVVSKVVGHMASIPRTGRKGVKVYEGVIPATKIGIDLTPDDIQKLMFPRYVSEQQRILENLYDDLANCLKSVYAREEYNVIQALSTGKVNLNDPDGGVQGYFDYQVPATGTSNRFKTLATELKFTNVNADIFQIITDEAEVFEGQNGFSPQVMLCTAAVITLIKKNSIVKKAIHGQANSDKMVTLGMINQTLMQLELPVIIKYDRVADVDSTVRKLLLDTKKLVMLEGSVSIGADGFPQGTIAKYGDTARGPTVEALRAQMPNSGYDWPSSRIGGIFARIKPVDEGEGAGVGTTGVSATTIPNLGLIDRIRVLTVW